jgi:hypothetical protein
MWQGDGGVATPSADILRKPELMSAVESKPAVPLTNLKSPLFLQDRNIIGR